MTSGPVLAVDNLGKQFGSLAAVQNLSLEVQEGEVFGLLGPNGAGKTTTIRMICGLLKPDQGQVYFHGQPVSHAGPAWRARVGLCPQELVVWEKLTGLEQLIFVAEMYGLAPGKARANALGLLALLELTERRNSLAHTLSGGMRRRLNLALALVHEPELVVLDEPEAGLDPQSRVRVREFIQSLARVKTVILTTHDIDEADRLADRVAIIDHGQLLEVDTPEALKRRLGQGDVIELAIHGPDLATWKNALAGLVEPQAIRQVDHLVTLRLLDGVSKLAQILAQLSAAGVTFSDVRLRQNTLEDVFIELTGRKLRE